MTMSNLKTLTDIFSQRLFRVPDYQRGYSWGQFQLEQFWEDLMTLDLTKIPYHYTGTLTLAPANEENIDGASCWKNDAWLIKSGHKPFYIIDGQQRIFTIVILCNVILERFSEEESIHDPYREELRRRLVMAKENGKRSFILGYENDRTSAEYLFNEILGDCPSESSSKENLYTVNLRRAKHFFQIQTGRLSVQELHVLMSKILSALRFHVYEVDDEIDVSLRFETINNRGKALSTLELLKNRLIYLATLLPEPDAVKGRLRNSINEAWKTAHEYLGKYPSAPLDEEEFLQNHWQMYAARQEGEDIDVSHHLLHKHFVARSFLDNGTTPLLGRSDVESYVESFGRGVRTWFFLFHPDFSLYGAETRDWLGRIRRNSIGAFRPLLMAVMLCSFGERDVNRLLEAVYEFQSASERLVIPLSKTCEGQIHAMAHVLFRRENDNLTETIKTIRQLKDREISRVLHTGG